jgi:hypothetical protein
MRSRGCEFSLGIFCLPTLYSEIGATAHNPQPWGGKRRPWKALQGDSTRLASLLAVYTHTYVLQTQARESHLLPSLGTVGDLPTQYFYTV